MHNAAYQASGLPHKYTLQQSPRIHGLDSILRDPSFGGASISLPYKIDVLKLVDSLSVDAQAIGAVNTVIPLRSSTSHVNGVAVAVCPFVGALDTWCGSSVVLGFTTLV